MSKKRGNYSGAFVVASILGLILVVSVFIVLPKRNSGNTSLPVTEDTTAPYTVLNGNVPLFTDDEITDNAYEYYSDLDELGRCTYAVACIGPELMPTEDRQSIGQVKPSGWQISKYDFVDGKYLYNRCHLIGFQLTGENANERNLITGTRYLNVEGMLPFENMVADYIRETGNHVMYRVTPVFEEDDLVAKGVQIEAQSAEDRGAGILFNVFVHNRQPGVQIDYRTGDNWSASAPDLEEDVNTFVLNKNSKRFHLPDCESVGTISEKNKQEVTTSRKKLIDGGFKPCGACDP